MAKNEVMTIQMCPILTELQACKSMKKWEMRMDNDFECLNFQDVQMIDLLRGFLNHLIFF